MSLVHFSPFSELETVQTQMNRILDELAGWQGEGRSPWRPSIELLNGDAELTLKAALPGIAADDIDIQLTRESVRLSGEYKYEEEKEDEGCYHSEFRYGKFDRTIALPVAVDHENATAEFKDGILTLKLPKVVPAAKKIVKLQLGKSPETQKVLEEPTE
ncbi:MULTISPECIES: Hsp20/alpha crystallin family protein [Cyanophyceae]|uniref:Hsp20/alpha crystallin family protein n=1 Tax=Cyanophyceae TaxID=3028117 RepID=UPI00016DC5B6|nr:MULTISPECIES: Hsp20/alpha crystallin family protein [Cyanophyceae]ACA98659.1 small heat shock protein [Picosynechococcus sp. PCC 7002]SMH40086.1 heat shock protein Hsp20 [Picosynechococcus sp. OG1]SMQ78323.1 heat shock protein Hsp20 [Synechococcus sp. 7002]